MNEKIKVTIDRSKWRTGGNYPSATGTGLLTRLLNDEGSMCCLGFCCKAAGCSDKDIRNMTSPADVYLRNPDYSSPGSTVSFLLFDTFCSEKDEYTSLGQSSLAHTAIQINDGTLTREVKEQKLLELFRDSSFEIEFTGEYTDFHY